MGTFSEPYEKENMSQFGHCFCWLIDGQSMNQGTHDVVKDLVPNGRDHIECLVIGDRVDKHVAVDANEMSTVKDTVLVLASCVDDLQIILLVPNLDLLRERVLDGGVVGFNEVVVNKANRQRRLAYNIGSRWLASHPGQSPAHTYNCSPPCSY